MVLVSAVLCEAALRMVYPVPWYGYVYLPPQQHLFQYDGTLGWVGRPDSVGVFASLDFEHTVHHDEYGFRNNTDFYHPEKRNLLIVGDSFGWGWGVGDDEVVSSAMNDEAPGVNAYNLSAPGYGTDQAYLMVKRFFDNHADYRPEAVVLLFFINDFKDNVKTVRYGYPKARFILDEHGALQLTNLPIPNVPQVYEGERKLKRLPRTFGRNFHLYNLLDYFFRKKTFPHTKLMRGTRSLTPAEQETVVLTTAIVAAMKRLVESRGASLLLVTVFSGNDPHYPPFRKMLDKEGVRHERFERTVIPRNELWNDRHMNARGHRSLALQILKWLDGD